MISPLSVTVAHRVGTKYVVTVGLALIALGLGLLPVRPSPMTYRDCIGPFLIVGVGVAMALAPCTESVMGSVPKEEAGVGSATNDTAMQVGGALGVAVLGTALNLRYQHIIVGAIAHTGVPASVQGLIQSSVGAALAVAQRAPGSQGAALTLLARHAFVSGMDLGLVIATVVVGVAALIVAPWPSPNRGNEPSRQRRNHAPRVVRAPGVAPGPG